MPFNGSGVFTRVYNWVNDKNASINITASRMDGEFNGIATGLSQCVTKDGQTTITANLPMAGFKLTNVADAAATTEYTTYKQIQNNTAQWLGTPGGTVDALTASPTIALAAYVTGQKFSFDSIGANTSTTPTLNISGLGAVTITYRETALQAGDIPATGIITVVYTGTTFDLINSPLPRLLTRKTSAFASASTVNIGSASTDYVDITGTTTITSLGTGTIHNHVWVKFTGSLTLTHNATSLILPTGANIQTQAGDTAEFIRIAAGANWECVNYQRADGTSLGAVAYSSIASSSIATAAEIRSATASKLVDAAQLLTALTPYSSTVTTTSGTDAPFTGLPSGIRRVVLGIAGVSTNGTGAWTIEIGPVAGYETSSYAGTVQTNGSTTTFSTNFQINLGVIAADTYNGVVELLRGDSSTNTWHIKGSLAGPTGPLVYVSAGTKSIAGALDRVRVVAGGNTWDAGKITCEAFYF